MKLIYPIIFILLFLTCSIAQTNHQIEPECIDEHKSEYNTLISEFQNALKDQYSIKGELKGKHYKKFIEDISKMEVSREFFFNANRINYVKNLVKSELFENIWIKDSEQKKNNEEDEEILIAPNPYNYDDDAKNKRPDKWVLNTNSNYYNCLIKNTQNLELQVILTQLQKEPNLSPGLVSRAILTVKNFESDNTFLNFIAIEFYYEFMLNLNKLNLVQQ